VSGTADVLLREVWRATRGGEPPASLQISGTTGLASALPAPALALGAVAAQLLAARELTGSPAGPLTLDAAHVAAAFRSERHVRLGGRPAGPGFAPLSRFWRTADGWLRLHGNYPHHRAAAVTVLGDDVATGALGWTGRPVPPRSVDCGSSI
jgi:hypothetical protein